MYFRLIAALVLGCVLGCGALQLPPCRNCAPSVRPDRGLVRSGSVQMAGKLVTNELSATADASTTLPAGSTSLSDYLASPASDTALLSAEKILSGPVDGVYECEMAPITFFKLRITPLFSMQIDRGAGGDNELAVRVLKGGCRVGDKLSRTITIDALNKVKWSAADDGDWQLDTSISLALKVKQAPMNRIALKAWNVAGTAIVKGACAANGKSLLANIEDGYRAD